MRNGDKLISLVSYYMPERAAHKLSTAIGTFEVANTELELVVDELKRQCEVGFDGRESV